MAAIIASFLYLIVPKLLGIGVDQAFVLIQQGSYTRDEINSLLLNTALIVVSFGLARGVCHFIQMFLEETLSQRVSNDLRIIFFDKLHALSFSFHDRVHTGQLMSRGLSDIEGVRMFVQTGMIHIFRVLVMAIAAAIFMAMIDWRLAIFSLSFLPFMIFRSAHLRVQLRKTWRLIQDTLGELTTTMQENLAGIRVVRAFSSQVYENAKFDKTAKKVMQLRLDATKQTARGGGSISFSFLIAWAIVMWYGGNLVLNDEITIGEFTQFFFFLTLLRMPVRMIVMIVNSTSRGSSAGARIFEILDMPIDISDNKDSSEISNHQGTVEFKDVSLSYKNVNAISNINFKANPNHSIGIVGPPGSGKSSIAHLIPRFYDVDSGQILIDGQDLRGKTLKSIRNHIGIVEQDPILFEGTIRENITYGNVTAEDNDIHEVAELASIHSFIQSLPDQYETQIGERGVALSGGQRQRISIARALLREPKVLIFDDSTSSVDAVTDARIRSALNNRKSSAQTVITIAHRISSIKQCSEILVLVNGQVIERGTHEELIALKGHYRDLWDLQRNQIVDIDE